MARAKHRFFTVDDSGGLSIHAELRPALRAAVAASKRTGKAAVLQADGSVSGDLATGFPVRAACTNTLTMYPRARVKTWGRGHQFATCRLTPEGKALLRAKGYTIGARRRRRR